MFIKTSTHILGIRDVWNATTAHVRYKVCVCVQVCVLRMCVCVLLYVPLIELMSFSFSFASSTRSPSSTGTRNEAGAQPIAPFASTIHQPAWVKWRVCVCEMEKIVLQHSVDINTRLLHWIFMGFMTKKAVCVLKGFYHITIGHIHRHQLLNRGKQPGMWYSPLESFFSTWTTAPSAKLYFVLGSL